MSTICNFSMHVPCLCWINYFNFYTDMSFLSSHMLILILCIHLIISSGFSRLFFPYRFYINIPILSLMVIIIIFPLHVWQGTVSELLSKPKLWDKLTEKGRDSYRKMHAWATDDNAVFLLKSLIPKRGTSISQFFNKIFLFFHFLGWPVLYTPL